PPPDARAAAAPSLRQRARAGGIARRGGRVTTSASARPDVERSWGGTLAGTGVLLRFLLRRDRIKLPGWTLGIAVFGVYYATALPELFPDQASLRSISGFLRGPIGTLLGGPGYGFDD